MPGRYARDMSRLWLFLLVGGCTPTLSVGSACVRPTDCPAPYTCLADRCRVECVGQRDCPLGARCILRAEGGSCALPDDPDCRRPESPCESGLLCLSGTCVNACDAVADCPSGSVCARDEVGLAYCEREDVDAGAADAGGADASFDGGQQSDAPVCVPADCAWGECADGVCNDPVALALDDARTCVVRAAGTMHCCGSPNADSLGDGLSHAGNVTALTTVFGVGDARSPATSGTTSCVVRRDGRVSCWGYNRDGALGTGDTTSHPTATDSLVSAVVQLEGAHDVDRYCARHEGGGVTCWGTNAAGEAGTPGPMAVLSPFDLPSPTDFTDVAVGRNHTCGISTSRGVVCWGSDASGQLGDDPAMVDHPSPTAVSGVTAPVDVAAGGSHTCAVESAGTVRCWGSGGSGELGDGVGATQRIPVRVSGLTDAEAVCAGLSHSCALRASGAVVCWGQNGPSGVLGNGSTATSLEPVPVTGLDDAVAIACGANHTCALRGTGDVVCWGQNVDGRLGTGSTDPATTPARMLPPPPP